MAKKTNPAVIGAFVVGAVVLTIAAVVIWGSRTWFERKYEYVCYFPGSVNGLSAGAPVKYRGVELGRVKEIRIRYLQKPEDTRIPVFVEIWGKRLRELGGEREPSPALLQELVARGLRARIETLSIVTGVLYVSLDQIPGSPLEWAQVPGKGGLPEIPALPTELEEAQKSVLALVAKVKSADIKSVAESISKAAANVSQLVGSPELQQTLRELPPLVSAASQLTSTLNAETAKSLTALRGTLDTARGAISPDAPLPVDLAQTLSNVDKAALAVRELADFLRRNPHSIVAGTKPRGAEQ